MGSLTGFVFKKQCGRCPAVEEISVTLESIKKGVDPSKDKSRSMSITLGGEEILHHEFLCEACQDICMRHVDSIAKELSKKSSTRSRVDEDEDD